jgi:hypothetical protein
MMNRRELLGSAGAMYLLPALPVLGTGAGSPAPAFEAMLRLGPARGGVGNHRWADVLDGTVTGHRLVGLVRSGRLDWHVDPASGAVEAQVRCQIHCIDGRIRELRERGVRASAAGQGRVRLRPFMLP